MAWRTVALGQAAAPASDSPTTEKALFEDMPVVEAAALHAQSLEEAPASVTVITAGDNTNGGLGTPVLLRAHPVGYCPLQVRAVMATGTTASSIVGIAD